MDIRKSFKYEFLNSLKKEFTHSLTSMLVLPFAWKRCITMFCKIIVLNYIYETIVGPNNIHAEWRQEDYDIQLYINI